ncbi:hypothetical protein Indivirus_4_8 [Indivirus ILV1]|uniref:Uncharacterized protein n=1 Tax=Indivirus ILV1 TaxID=1977633 RepID=A0A1V0SDP8_9VIRU|nr:hypothetical protein Indivirus_4_8 [Indivirus ILV1]
MDIHSIFRKYPLILDSDKQKVMDYLSCQYNGSIDQVLDRWPMLLPDDRQLIKDRQCLLLIPAIKLAESIAKLKKRSLKPAVPPVSPVLPVSPVSPVLQVSPVSPVSQKLYKETNETNYGHQNLIWEDTSGNPFDFKLPPIGSDGYGYGYGYGYQTGGTSDQLKHEYIADLYNNGLLKRVENQKEYFELSRYVMYNDNVIPLQNTYVDEPTLSISLFAPPNVIYNKQLTDWSNKYFGNQIRLLLTFKRQFPNGNIRIYFDKYLCDGLENGRDTKIELVRTHLKNNEFELEYKPIIEEYFDQFFNISTQLNQIQFESPLHKFLAYYDLAGKSYYDEITKKISFNNNHIPEFFVYKFNGPFVEKLSIDDKGVYIEDKNGQFECHQTDGFIGQLVRYISGCQQDYIHNNNKIKRARHLIFRDGHSNSIGLNDSQWIRELNRVCKIHKKDIILNHASNYYSSLWHDIAKCGDEIYKIAPIAGQPQFCNYTNNNKFIEDGQLVKTIGMAFIVSKKNNNLPLLEILRKIPFAQHHDNKHPDVINKRAKMYRYGIDEYILTSYYGIDEIKQKTIYNHNMWIAAFVLWIKGFYYKQLDKHILNPIFVAFNVILYYLVYSGKIKSTATDWYQIFREIESLRIKTNLENNQVFDSFMKEMGLENLSKVDQLQKFGLFLSIIPNKYHLTETVYNVDGVVAGDNLNKTSPELVFKNLTNESYTDELAKKFFKDVFMKSSLYNIHCSSISLAFPLDWCTKPYLFRKNEEMDKQNCPTEYYATGFYDVEMPKDKIILRTPKDLDAIINVVGKLTIQDTKYSEGMPISADDLVMPVNIHDHVKSMYGGKYMDDIYKQKYIKYKNKYLSLLK